VRHSSPVYSNHPFAYDTSTARHKATKGSNRRMANHPTDKPSKIPKHASKLAAILEEYRQTERQIAQLTARGELRTARDRHSRRKRETRCKIILGGAVVASLRDLGDDDKNRDVLLKLMREQVTETRDILSMAEFFPELFPVGAA